MKTAIALGTFDGVHIGHKAVINAAVSSGFEAVAVAFPSPPRTVMAAEKCNLTTATEKAELIKNLGVKRVHYLDFLAVRDLSPQAFLEFLKNTFNPAVISCGFNYRFGKNAEGNADFLLRYCQENGICATITEPIKCRDITVSSTKIRSLLLSGEIALANTFLSEPFSFSGEIIHGDRRGRTIGFPTINQLYPKDKAPVKHGVYSSLVTVLGKTYKGITNIGVRPTFRNGLISAETHIIDFSGEIYGQTAEIKLLSFLRAEQRFSSAEELKKNIENDLNKVCF